MNDAMFFDHNAYVKTKMVDVSIERSNIRHKNATYYARVCKTGRVKTDELLSILQEKAPYIDINIMRAGLEKLEEIIVDLVTEGKTVDLLNLGSFSLASEGKVEIKEGMKHCVEEPSNVSKREESIEDRNADFDVSEAVITQPSFKLKFAPSAICKKYFERVKMRLAIKKRRAPVIKTLEDATPKSCSNKISMIKVKGSNLKILGDKAKVGIYIKEESGNEIKIEKDNIIQNTPTTLLILLNKKLNIGAVSTLSIITQYAKMGSRCTTSRLRGTSVNFEMTQKEKIAVA